MYNALPSQADSEPPSKKPWRLEVFPSCNFVSLVVKDLFLLTTTHTFHTRRLELVPLFPSHQIRHIGGLPPQGKNRNAPSPRLR